MISFSLLPSILEQLSFGGYIIEGRLKETKKGGGGGGGGVYLREGVHYIIMELKYQTFLIHERSRSSSGRAELDRGRGLRAKCKSLSERT